MYPIFPSNTFSGNSSFMDANDLLNNAVKSEASNALQLLVMDVYPNPTSDFNTLKYMLNQEGRICRKGCTFI